MKTVTVAECPYCGETISFKDMPKIGQLGTCHMCEEEYEVIDLDPILLDWPLSDDDIYYEDDEEFEEDEW